MANSKPDFNRLPTEDESTSAADRAIREAEAVMGMKNGPDTAVAADAPPSTPLHYVAVMSDGTEYDMTGVTGWSMYEGFVQFLGVHGYPIRVIRADLLESFAPVLPLDDEDDDANVDDDDEDFAQGEDTDDYDPEADAES